jgi:hypothetical protein
MGRRVHDIEHFLCWIFDSLPINVDSLETPSARGTRTEKVVRALPMLPSHYRSLTDFAWYVIYQAQYFTDIYLKKSSHFPVYAKYIEKPNVLLPYVKYIRR